MGCVVITSGNCTGRTGGSNTSSLAIRAADWGLGGAASFAALVPPAATANGDISQGTASCPVPPAGLAEVSWLREAVVVEIAKFGVGGLTPRAF